ncbi:MAG: hypothetical protein AAFP69_20835, partial [Planctomycetota bacterium]
MTVSQILPSVPNVASISPRFSRSIAQTLLAIIVAVACAVTVGPLAIGQDIDWSMLNPNDGGAATIGSGTLPGPQPPQSTIYPPPTTPAQALTAPATADPPPLAQQHDAWYSVPWVYISRSLYK